MPETSTQDVNPPEDTNTTPPEAPPEEPVVEAAPEPVADKPVAREKQICIRLGEILAQYGGMESNIPVNPNGPHEYWILKDELSGLRAAK